jgi:hypothetical protein
LLADAPPGSRNAQRLGSAGAGRTAGAVLAGRAVTRCGGSKPRPPTAAGVTRDLDGRPGGQPACAISPLRSGQRLALRRASGRRFLDRIPAIRSARSLNAGARSSANAIAALSGPSLLSLLTDAGAAVSQLLILLTNVLNGFVLSISLQRLLANILSGVVEYALIISGVLGILTRL